ncbi:9117_t:CDS:1, partial [Paraglomus occultum]
IEGHTRIVDGLKYYRHHRRCSTKTVPVNLVVNAGHTLIQGLTGSGSNVKPLFVVDPLG